MNMNPHVTPPTRINLKYIQALNIRPNTIKLIDENVGKKLLSAGLGNNFSRYDTRSIKTKSKNQQIVLHQM